MTKSQTLVSLKGTCIWILVILSQPPTSHRKHRSHLDLEEEDLHDSKTTKGGNREAVHFLKGNFREILGKP